MNEAKLGILSKLYYRTAGDFDNPTFTEIRRVSDLAVKASWQKGNSSTRASRVTKNRKTMLDISITGKIRVSNDDESYIALWEAAHSDDTIDIMALNGPQDDDGSRGYRFEAQVFDNSESQNLGDVLFLEFTLEPADTDNEPQKVVVDEGAPVFTEAAPTTDAGE